MTFLTRFRIVGHSMSPQIKNGEDILISSLPYWFKNPQINDIVAFKEESGKVLIKRIFRIKNKQYSVRGDNKNDSLDSRNFGDISKKQIIGKVIYKF